MEDRDGGMGNTSTYGYPNPVIPNRCTARVPEGYRESSSKFIVNEQFKL